jgi:monoamine oxidase
VGAGFAGLTAALRLTQAGRSVIILEARNRVGGRVLTETLPDGTWLDMGGTWIGPQQTHVNGLAAEMGVGTYPTYDTGQMIMDLSAISDVPADSEDLWLPGLVVGAGTAALFAQLDALSNQIPLDAPWTASQASAFDAQSFNDWMLANINDPTGLVIPALRHFVTTIVCADPSQTSLLGALWGIHW